jgi:hypothetical protein
MFLFIALRCGLDARQVYFDLYISGLTPLRGVIAQAAVTIQVIAGTHVE